MLGGWVSTPPPAVPIPDESPQEDKAQKVKSFVPSRRGTEQADPVQANDSPLRVPSTVRMLNPGTGSLELISSVAAPLHQPDEPGLEQRIAAEAEASG
jgi:hypothetical protein